MWVDLRESVCLPVFVWGCYPHQLPEERVTRKLIRSGARVFDIGANIGYLTRLFSDLAHPGGLVVAVEPMPRALILLRRNAQLGPGRVVVLPRAVGPERGTARLMERQALDRSLVSFQGSLPQVSVVTIDDLSDEYGFPDFIKLDIEGAELPALRGATRTLQSSKPPIVLFEYIEANARNFGGYSLRDVAHCFPAHGYRFCRVAWPGILVDLDQGGYLATDNYLAVPRHCDQLMSELSV